MAQLVPAGNGFTVEFDRSCFAEMLLDREDAIRHEMGKRLSEAEANALLERVKAKVREYIASQDNTFPPEHPHIVAATYVRYADDSQTTVIANIGGVEFPAASMSQYGNKPDRYCVLVHHKERGGWYRIFFEKKAIRSAQS